MRRDRTRRRQQNVERPFLSIHCRLATDLLEALLSFARKMKTKVIAEGIETREELKVLQSLGVPYGQGFLLARPAPFEQCRRYLTGQPLDLTQQEPFGQETFGQAPPPDRPGRGPRLREQC